MAHATRKCRQALQAARDVDAAIRSLAHERNRRAVELAKLLLDMEERGLARALGFASVAAYAEVAIHQSPSKTRQLVALARKLRDMPQLDAIARTGELPWTKLRAVANAATGDTVEQWVEKARESSREELERAASEARGEEPVGRVAFEVSREQADDVKLAVEAVQRERPELSFGAALAEICRGFLVGSAGGAAGEGKSAPSGPRPRLVVYTCGSCGESSRETREGAVELEGATVESVACDAEILDTRRGPAAVRRAVPPRVASYVDSRDRGRCRVPGCPHRLFVERHHEAAGGWREVGHAPEHLLLLCSQHHEARHEGLLRIEGDAEGALTFRLADGTVLAEGAVTRGTDGRVQAPAVSARRTTVRTSASRTG